VETLIAYPEAIDLQNPPRAYCITGDGEAWGPLWPYFPEQPQVGYRPPGQVTLSGTLLQTVENICPGFGIETPTLQAGEYYPRIARVECLMLELGPCVPKVADTPYFNSFIGSLQQVETLFDSLSSLLRVTHPEQDNLKAYGGAMRDLIILACTEVEAQWKGVLKANNLTARKGRYTTEDYVRLLPAMKLDAYRVELMRYPGLPELMPFADWSTGQPTQSLGWYDVYNKVKHGRETNFKEATLGNAIIAVAACVVMLAAQFGYETLQDYQFKNLFRFADIPKWDPKEWYYGRIPGVQWKPVNCPM
jgi:hypothetical protein